jgi:ethanolamine utilization protein EutA (predicted chaperonin)
MASLVKYMNVGNTITNFMYVPFDDGGQVMSACLAIGARLIHSCANRGKSAYAARRSSNAVENANYLVPQIA